MFQLKDELHIHLYGCLTAEDVFELGKDRWQKVPERLAWFEAEFQKAFGRPSRLADYWTKDNGFDLLAEDFLFVGAAPFREFQARFNLMIALMPVATGDHAVLHRVMEGQRKAGIRHAEFRSFVPPPLAEEALRSYFAGHAKEAARFERESDGAFVPRIAFSISRDPVLAVRQYAVLKEEMLRDADVRRAVTAVDFCGVEEGNPPKSIRAFIQKILADNAADPRTALAVLYHVGESFTDMSQQSAIRWVHEAHRMGAHRLGHAMALGLAPEALGEIPCKRTERVEERRDHLAWLLAEQNWLEASGFPVSVREVTAELDDLANLDAAAPLDLVQGEWEVAMTKKLQDAVLDDLVEHGAVFESCPTSNFRIGQIPAPAYHPLPRFLEAGARVIVSSDDPGIFAVTLQDEEELCRELFQLSSKDLERIRLTGEAYRSELVSGRGIL